MSLSNWFFVVNQNLHRSQYSPIHQQYSTDSIVLLNSESELNQIKLNGTELVNRYGIPALVFEFEFQSVDVDVDVGRGWVCKWVKPQLGGAQACLAPLSWVILRDHRLNECCFTLWSVWKSLCCGRGIQTACAQVLLSSYTDKHLSLVLCFRTIHIV